MYLATRRHGCFSNACFLILVMGVALFTPALSIAQTMPTPMEAQGAQPNRGTFSVLPWESIDMVSGNGILTFTDLVLPGNAGMDLRFQRVLNLNNGVWHMGLPGPAQVLLTHAPNHDNPTIIAMDGGEQLLFEAEYGNTNVFRSTAYGRFTRSTRVLELPNGLVYHFDHQPNPTNPHFWAVTAITDPYGNAIDISYSSNGDQTYVQHVGSATRTVTLAHDGADVTLTWNGRTWRYVYTNGSLTEVQPPVGPHWQFAYSTYPNSTTPGYGRRLIVTTPNGGTVRYDVENQPGPPPSGPAYFSWVVRWRVSDDLRGHGGTWLFGYSDEGGDVLSSFVDGPNGIRHTYGHNRVDDAWFGGVHSQRIMLTSHEVIDNGTTRERTVLTWRWSDTDAVGLFLSIYPDGTPDSVSVEPPLPVLPSAVSVTRDGQTWARSFGYHTNTNFNDFGQPYLVTETGDDDTRTHTYAFQAFMGTPYLGARITSHAVSSWSVPLETATYDGSTGFLSSQTHLGIQVTYTPDAYGNVAAAADGVSGHQTTLEHAWGVVSNTLTPQYGITRVINSDGTVDSETRQSQTQSWGYDDLGRITQVTPRVGAPMVTAYDNTSGTWITETQDGATRQQDLDGFGRVTTTASAAGVHTATVYDAWGRPTAQSGPYDGSYGRQDTATTYDALNRVVRVTRPDGSWVEHTYTGLDVRIAEGQDATTLRVTEQHWVSVGSPGEARLVGVQEGNGLWTSYAYTPLGGLTAVCGPGESAYAACTTARATRTWHYNTSHHVDSETHPESGTTTSSYDSDGLLHETLDAAGIRTTFTYDGNHRLTRAVTNQYPWTEPRDTVYTYDDWDNRLSADNRGVVSAFTYEGGLRLVSRQDAIGGQFFETRYAYDPKGNIIEIDYPSGHAVKYSHDGDHRILQVWDGTGPTVYASNVQYHPSGAVKQYTAGNGVTHQVSFDALARPATITAGALGLGYTYDGLGNVTLITDSRGSGYRQELGYDALDRLTSAGPLGGWISYAYDAKGNRTTGATYADATQRLTSFTAGDVTTTYGYSPTGQVTSATKGAQVDTFEYTREGMLQTARVGSGTDGYTYDSDGLRTRAVDGTTTRYYVHGLGSQVLNEYAEQQGVNTWQVAYLYLGTRLLGAIRATAPPAGMGRLTVSVSGSGTGWVTSSPTAFNCRGTCAQFFGLSSTVTLTATADGGSTFAGWSGDATCGSGQVTMAAAATCKATFVAIGGARVSPSDVRSGAYGSTMALVWWGQRVADQSYFRIERSLDGADWAEIATPTAQSFLDAGAPCGVLAYRVRAHWNSDNSDSPYSNVTGFRNCIPAAPTGLRALPLGASWMLILWEDQSTDETDFQLQWKGDGANATWSQGLTLSANTASYLHMTPPCGLVTYRIRAHRSDSAKYSDWSTESTATRTCADPGPTAVAGGLPPGAGPSPTASTPTLMPSAVAVPAGTLNTGAIGTSRSITTSSAIRWASLVLAALVFLTAWAVLRRRTMSRTPVRWATRSAARPLAAPYRASQVVGLLVLLAAMLLPRAALAQAGQTVEYYHLDALGSVRVVTDQNAQVIARHDFLPFGEETPPPSGVTQKKLFTGHERDADTGLDYFGARYYAPQIGRFTTIDPVYTWSENLTDPQRWNRYANVRNNPLRWVDPDGRDISPIYVVWNDGKLRETFVDTRVVDNLRSLISAAEKNRIDLRFGEVFETPEYHDAIVTKNIKNGTGTSPHLVGLAFDIDLSRINDLSAFTKLADAFGFVPVPGRKQSEDPVHFQAEGQISRGRDGRPDQAYRDMLSKNQSMVKSYRFMTTQLARMPVQF